MRSTESDHQKMLQLMAQSSLFDLWSAVKFYRKYAEKAKEVTKNLDPRKIRLLIDAIEKP